MNDIDKLDVDQNDVFGSSMLREKILKPALENLDWSLLKEHLDQNELNDYSLDILLGHLRRTNSLIMPYPNKKRETQRSEFYECIKKYIFERLGETAFVSLLNEIALLDRIEKGYRGILDILGHCEISNFSPEIRVSAYISRAAHQYAYLMKDFYKLMEAKKEIGPRSPLLMSEDLAQVSPDQVISAIVETLTISLLMEAYINSWFDTEGFVELPTLPEIGEEEQYKAGSTELLCIWWQRWRHTEERRRFLGGIFEEYTPPNLPSWAPQKAQSVIVYNPLEMVLFDYISNERLFDRIGQTYLEMIFETNVDANIKSILDGSSLLPNDYISSDEVHAAVTISEILGYDIVIDKEQPAGLRFVEWVRGFAVLKEITRHHSGIGNKVDSLILEKSFDELLVLLNKNGMHKESAFHFLNAVTLSQKSKDLFDTPLIKLRDGKLLLFAPGVISTSIARVVLSTIANQGEPLARKGKAFENYILSFFKKIGHSATSIKFQEKNQEYEYDVILPWDDYIFIFECKNHSLSNNNPIKAYYLEKERRSNAKQVNRLLEGLQRHPDRVNELLGLDITKKNIIPCVLNSLPFSLPGKKDGVYFTDASAMKRFFQERYFHIKTPHQINDNARVLHRTAVHSLWSGDEPSPEDFIKHLENPFQLQLMRHHIQIVSRPFGIGNYDLVAAGEFFRSEITIESYCDLVGISSEEIRNEMERVKSEVDKVKEKIDLN